MSDVTLHLGDCLDVMRSMPDGCVDAVVTDPPYFLPARHYSTRKEFPRSLCDLSILEHFFRDVFAEIARITKPTGVWYVFCDGQSYPVFFALAYRHARRSVPLVWDKQVAINGYSWRHQHELILFSEMENAPAVPTGDGDILTCRAVPVDDRDHPAQKPIDLLSRLIRKSTQPQSVILDPFAGSCSTGVACIREGRSFIGIEREPAYHAIAEARIAHARGEVRPDAEQPGLDFGATA